MKRRRRGFETFNLSFLDVVSCGFGAIVLLLVIVKVSEPKIAAERTTPATAQSRLLQEEFRELETGAARAAAEVKRLAATSRELAAEIDVLRDRLARQQRERRETAAARAADEVVLNRLHDARQELTEEMRRLQRTPIAAGTDSPIGGLPVDSEYVIFIIDTSGSMQQHAWPGVRRKMTEILEIYPRMRGLQVMNDMGDYMFSQYAGRWIPDTPARRQAILRRLAGWTPFSNSSPVEGVTAAVKRFYAEDKKISLYIFGDDFSRGTIQDVVDTVDAVNRSLLDGSRRVRIHAVGFPVLFGQPGAGANVARFAALMRRLAEDNDGSFVGLTSLR